MTNDEKAKAYDMALEAARKELGVDRKEWKVVEHVLRNIFPELRESEDERIRKEMISFLRSPFIKENLTDEKVAPWLDCLEKQKEQKPNIELIQRSWYMEGYHDREFGKEPKWILKTGESGPKHELNPRYGQPLAEQRPTEEQLHNLNEAIKGLRMDDCERIADSLHSLYNILKTQEQKPAEKPSMLELLREHLVNTPKEQLDAEFEELKEFTIPKPAEWSEEDEKMIEKINGSLNGLKTYINEHPSMSQEYKESVTKGIERQQNWLKSLRPSWKPSEEQMEALLWCIAHLGGADRRVLAELYEHLKMYCK